MKILYCINSLAAAGGMQRVLSVKAGYLAAKGYVVHIAVRDNMEALPHFELAAGITVHYLQKPLDKALQNLLHALRPAIAISMGDDDQYTLWRVNDGSKKVLEFHFTRHHLLHLVNGLPHVRWRGLRRLYARWRTFRQTRCASHYDKLVLLTHCDLALWKAPANAVVIPNPLSFAPIPAPAAGARTILSAGRFIATKGFDLLLAAFAPVARLYPDWQLCLHGAGQDEQLLRERVSAYELSGQVKFLPFVSDIRQIMGGAAIYACASRYEGFGLVLTEAMACGVCCVAFDCPCGPGEIITHETNGLLVPPGDVDAFSAALIRLIAAPDLRFRLATTAHAQVGRFGTGPVMAHWEQLFKTLVYAS